MGELTPEEIHILNSAEGWLGLGDPVSAAQELDGLRPALQSHPAVLRVRYETVSAARQWDKALEIATALTRIAPKHPAGWIQRSFALHELKKTNEARENILNVLDRFPDSALMRYNLACYECQLGDLSQATLHLEKAFALPGGMELRENARHDPDLKPLWSHLADL